MQEAGLPEEGALPGPRARHLALGSAGPPARGCLEGKEGRIWSKYHKHACSVGNGVAILERGAAHAPWPGLFCPFGLQSKGVPLPRCGLERRKEESAAQAGGKCLPLAPSESDFSGLTITPGA